MSTWCWPAGQHHPADRPTIWSGPSQEVKRRSAFVPIIVADRLSWEDFLARSR